MPPPLELDTRPSRYPECAETYDIALEGAYSAVVVGEGLRLADGPKSRHIIWRQPRSIRTKSFLERRPTIGTKPLYDDGEAEKSQKLI